MAGPDRQDSGDGRLNMSDIIRTGTTRRYSDSVAHAGTVYLVEVPATLDASISVQTEEVLASIELAVAGLRQRQRATVDGNHLPARHGELFGDERNLGCLGARRQCALARLRSLLNPGYKLEIVVTAACG